MQKGLIGIKGCTVGSMKTTFIWVANQEVPYIQSEYVVLEQDDQPSVIMEVMETLSLGVLTPDNLPQGVTYSELMELSFTATKTTYLAYVKVLDFLSTPIPPHAPLRSAVFEEIKPFLNSVEPDRSFVLGVLKGTERLHALLPEPLKNVAPIMERNEIKPQTGIPFLFDFRKFQSMPNIGIFGGAGSGKSVALRSVAEEVMKHRLPAILLDPHNEFSFSHPVEKADARAFKKLQDAYEILTVGEDIGISFEDLTTAELLRLFSFFDPSQVMESAIRTLHEKGDTRLNFKNKLLAMKKGFEEDKKSPYQREETVLNAEEQVFYLSKKDKVSGFETIQAILWRFEQLEATQIFNKDASRIESLILNRKLAVIRGDAFRTELLATYIIRKLYYKRVSYENARQDVTIKEKPNFFPGFLVMADEAHRYAPKTHRSHPTRDLLVEAAREGRKFGIYLIVATQRAASLDETLTAQLNTKFIFRTTNAQDMEVFKAEANLIASDLELLPNLASGHCFASSAIFSKNFAVQFKCPLTLAPTAENPFDQLPPINEETEEMRFILSYLQQQPNRMIRTHQLNELLTVLTAQLNPTFTSMTLLETLSQMQDRGDLIIIQTPFGNEFKLNS